SFDIITTPFGNQKSVFVHLKEVDGAWIDVPATFIEVIPGNREIWRAYVAYGQGACPTPKAAPETFEFAIKVSRSSGDTGHNNDGGKYKATKGSGSLLVDTNVALGGASVYTPPTGPRTFQAVSLVRNIAYAKNVDIVYSTDGWKTTKTASLNYFSSYIS